MQRRAGGGRRSPATSATRASRRRAARNLAIVANWSTVAARRSSSRGERGCRADVEGAQRRDGRGDRVAELLGVGRPGVVVARPVDRVTRTSGCSAARRDAHRSLRLPARHRGRSRSRSASPVAERVGAERAAGGRSHAVALPPGSENARPPGHRVPAARTTGATSSITPSSTPSKRAISSRSTSCRAEPHRRRAALQLLDRSAGDAAVDDLTDVPSGARAGGGAAAHERREAG